MKTSKIKNIQGAGEKNGWLNFDIDLEDGTSGRKGFKKQPTYLQIGTEVEYEMREDFNGLFKSLKVKGFQAKNNSYDVKGVQAGHSVTAAIYLLQADINILDDNTQYENQAQKLYYTALKVAEITETVKNKL